MHLIVSCIFPVCFHMHWQLLGDKFEVECCCGAVRYMHAIACSHTIFTGAVEVLHCLQMFYSSYLHISDLNVVAQNNMPFAKSV